MRAARITSAAGAVRARHAPGRRGAPLPISQFSSSVFVHKRTAEDAAAAPNAFAVQAAVPVASVQAAMNVVAALGADAEGTAAAAGAASLAFTTALGLFLLAGAVVLGRRPGLATVGAQSSNSESGASGAGAEAPKAPIKVAVEETAPEPPTQNMDVNEWIRAWRTKNSAAAPVAAAVSSPPAPEFVETADDAYSDSRPGARMRLGPEADEAAAQPPADVLAAAAAAPAPAAATARDAELPEPASASTTVASDGARTGNVWDALMAWLKGIWASIVRMLGKPSGGSSPSQA